MTSDEWSILAWGVLLLIGAAIIWRQTRDRRKTISLLDFAVSRVVPVTVAGIGVIVLLADTLYAYS